MAETLQSEPEEQQPTTLDFYLAQQGLLFELRDAAFAFLLVSLLVEGLGWPVLLFGLALILFAVGYERRLSASNAIVALVRYTAVALALMLVGVFLSMGLLQVAMMALIVLSLAVFGLSFGLWTAKPDLGENQRAVFSFGVGAVIASLTALGVSIINGTNNAFPVILIPVFSSALVYGIFAAYVHEKFRVVIEERKDSTGAVMGGCWMPLALIVLPVLIFIFLMDAFGILTITVASVIPWLVYPVLALLALSLVFHTVRRFNTTRRMRRLTELAIAFVMVEPHRRAVEVIDKNPILLSPDVDDILQRLATAQTDEEARLRVEERRQLLRLYENVEKRRKEMAARLSKHPHTVSRQEQDALMADMWDLTGNHGLAFLTRRNLENPAWEGAPFADVDLRQALGDEQFEQYPILQDLERFLSAKTWREGKEIVMHNPELITSPEVESSLKTAIEKYTWLSPDAYFQVHLDVLLACRAKGIDEGFADKIEIGQSANRGSSQ